ncbi:MAG: hypothetical protein MI741_11445 [Rhodospirillales bacterium]|nr:hypothetical protein [Rhodospirillales bacterium]
MISKATVFLTAGLAVFAVLSDARAQQGDTGGAPLLLAPPVQLQPPAQAPDAAPSGTAAGETPPQTPGTGVQVDALQTIDPDSVGVLTAGDGGFGETMWQGTKRRLVDDLLPRLPIKTSSATMRDLERRLLLSAAAPPTGEKKAGSLISLRTGLLAMMGDLDSADSLLQASPERGANPDLMRIEADTRFLANDNARACGLAAARINEDDDPYWQKAFSFCQALADEHDKAALGAALFRELGGEDEAFFALIEALAGGDKSLESMTDATPLHLAMARAAGVQLPADVVARDRPAVLRAVATSPNAPVNIRLEAAERAEAMGALPAETLRQLYTAISFSEEDLANPLSRAEAETGPLSRALLYRTSMIQTVPTAQAEAIGRAFELAREGGRYTSTVRVFLPVIQRIPPSAELLWFAPEAVRAFLIAGQKESAMAWYGVLRASALFNPESASAVTKLKPLIFLAGAEESEEWKPEALSAWWQVAQGYPEGRDRGSLMFSLFDAFDQPVADGLWEGLLDGPQRTTVAMPRPALWFQLRAAASADRIGETVLLSLLTLGDGGPEQADPLTLRDVLSRLRAVGLEAEARALAIEAAVAAGI